MWALVVDEKVVKTFQTPSAFVHPTTGNQHPRNWIRYATSSEKEAVGIVEVTESGTSKNDSYYNVSESALVVSNSGKTVTKTFTSTAKTLSTLQATHLQQRKTECYNALTGTDWYVIRKAENSTAIPAKITAYRTAVKTVYESTKTAINDASDVDKLAEVYDIPAGASRDAKEFNGTSASVISTSNNTITINSHGFVDDELITYSAGSDNDKVVGGLVDGERYYVFGKTTNTFKLSHTNSHMGDAAAISLTAGASAGTAHTITSGGVPPVGNSWPDENNLAYKV